jgi:hypothetical protein
MIRISCSSAAKASGEKSASVMAIRLRASATILFSPLMYVLSLGPNSSIRSHHHITCSVLKWLYTKFWWSVKTSISCPRRTFLYSLSVSMMLRSSRSVVVFVCVPPLEWTRAVSFGVLDVLAHRASKSPPRTLSQIFLLGISSLPYPGPVRTRGR